jgi:hypothetical protein
VRANQQYYGGRHSAQFSGILGRCRKIKTEHRLVAVKTALTFGNYCFQWYIGNNTCTSKRYSPEYIPELLFTTVAAFFRPRLPVGCRKRCNGRSNLNTTKVTFNLNQWVGLEKEQLLQRLSLAVWPIKDLRPTQFWLCRFFVARFECLFARVVNVTYFRSVYALIYKDMVERLVLSSI